MLIEKIAERAQAKATEGHLWMAGYISLFSLGYTGVPRNPQGIISRNPAGAPRMPKSLT